MARATYAATVIRAHLRALAPLPTNELAALKRVTAELGAIGRNINVVARAVNQGSQSAAVQREELKSLFRVCQVLRDHVTALMTVNLDSWTCGYDKTHR
jgi:hypothetical protein